MKLADIIEKRALLVVVPVHRHSCHRQRIQLSADIASRSLRDLLSPSRGHGDLAKHAQDAFLVGNQNLALVLRRRIRFAMREPETKPCKEELSALAVSNAAILFDGNYFAELQAASGTASKPSPDLLLGACNVVLNTDVELKRAVSLFDAAMALGSWSKADATRRRAKFGYEVSIAAEAQKAARDANDEYATRTATNVLGWAGLVHKGRRSLARDRFESVFYASGQLRLSWWHRMMAHFGLGVITYLQDRDLSTAAKHLQIAEYISALLGLRPNRIPDVRNSFSTTTVDLWPRDYLNYFVSRSGCGERRARRILQDARDKGIIAEGIRDALLRTTRCE